MMTNTETPLEVTQADRELYLDLRPHFRRLYATAIGDGHWDAADELQTIARHRIASAEVQSAEVARLRAEIERLREGLKEASGIINTVSLTDEYGDIDGDQSAIINAQQRIKAALAGESA